MRYESHKRDLFFKCLWSFVFLYFLGGIRNSEDLEYIVTNRAGETVTTLINQQQRESEYHVSGRNDANQALTKANATGTHYGGTNVTFVSREPPSLYQGNESAASN